MIKLLQITAHILPDNNPFTVIGPDALILSELLKDIARGCTAVDHLGPCWSGYVFNPKREHSLAIEKVQENHGGQFESTHERYLLRNFMEIVARCNKASKVAI